MKRALTASLALALSLTGTETGYAQSAPTPTPTTKILALGTINPGVDQAQAALDQAQLGVRETQVTAPVDGVVFDRQASPGALVGPTSPIVTLIPPQLDVVVNVDEAQLGDEGALAGGEQADLRWIDHRALLHRRLSGTGRFVGN